MAMKILGLAVVIMILNSCTQFKQGVTKDNTSYINYSRYRHVYEHFASANTVEEHRIINGMINYIEQGYYLDYYLWSKSRKKTKFGPSVSLDSLNVLIAQGEKIVSDTIWDRNYVDDAVIINSIQLALDARKRYEWARKYSTDAYIRFACPFRVSNERISNWREFHSNLLFPFIRDIPRWNSDTLHSLKLYLRTTLAPNDDVFDDWNKKEYRFIDLYHSRNHFDLLKAYAFEDLEDLLIISCQQMRAIGVAATYDFAHYSGNSDFAFGEIVCMDDDSSAALKPNSSDLVMSKGNVAKVFRKIYGDTSMKPISPFNHIAAKGICLDSIPRSLDFTDCIDVTSLRTQVSDIELPLSQKIGHIKVVYIAVWNQSEWKIIFYGDVNSITNKVVFKNMGRNILYRMALFDKGKTYPFGRPFYADSSGSVQFLAEASSQFSDVIVDKLKDEQIVEKTRHELYCYNSGSNTWSLLGSTFPQGRFLKLHNVPDMKLLKIINRSTMKTTRPFVTIRGQLSFY